MSTLAAETATPPNNNNNPEAVLALALMTQDWKTIGLDESDPLTAATSDTNLIVDHLVALLTVRLAAIAAPLGTYPDLSVVNICIKVLRTGEGWPDSLTPTVLAQLKEFVTRIIKGYKKNHYHNQEHACHVTLSACKLLDILLNHPSKPPAFGLRHDPLLLFVVVFSALIHDVEHQGLPNRQLALEKDRLAVLYNDQSIAEHWSLYIAFSELLQTDFDDLRNVMFTHVAPLEIGAAADGAASQHSHSHSNFSTAPAPTPEDLYFKFRKHVVNLVLCTDIASPERTQIGKSKWKEAFGDPYETVERKVRLEMRRASIGMTGKIIGGGRPSSSSNRRGSNFSELSFGVGPNSAPVAGAGGNLLQQQSSEDDHDDSLSMTPEHSDNDDFEYNTAPPMPVAPPHAARKASMGDGPGAPSRFERRLSTTSKSSLQSAKYRQRLGIRRSMDLSGETIEAYQRTSSMGYSPGNTNSGAATVYSFDLDADVPDELKATVLMEAIMTASDVAHNLQGFEQMKKWSNRLYLELRKAYVTKRGVDCSPKVSMVVHCVDGAPV